MPAGKALIFEIIGIDRASHAFKSVGSEVSKTEGKLSKFKVGAAAGLAIVGAAAVVFAAKSINKFEEVGGAAIQLQRIMGGTAEQVSRLNFAAEEKGVQADVLARGFGLLSKHLAANDKAWKSVGISARDANGNMKPSADLLPQIADKFATMPAGVEKTALALKLFGRGGKELLPLLNLGSKGLADFGAESDKLGHTLSGSQLAAIKKNIAAHREFKAALSGIEIQLGAALYPALAKLVPKMADLASTVATAVIPKLKEFGHWVADKLMPALTTAWQRVFPGVSKAFSQVTASLNGGKGGWKAVGDAILKVIDVGSRIAAVVLPLMIKAWGYQIRTYQTAAKVIGFFASVAKTAFRIVTETFLTMAGLVIHGAAKAFGWVPGIGPKLKKAANDFDAFRVRVNAALSGIKDQQVNLSVVASINGSTKLSNQAKAKALAIAFRASGGPVQAGHPYVVGDGGQPELFIPNQSGTIAPSVGKGRQMLGGGNTYKVTVNHFGSLTPADEARLGKAVIQAIKRYGGTGGNVAFA